MDGCQQRVHWSVRPLAIRWSSRHHHRALPIPNIRLPSMGHPNAHEIQSHRRLRLWLPSPVRLSLIYS